MPPTAPSAIESLAAKWTIKGQIGDKRELKSQKNADWRGYLVKILTLGATYEVNATVEAYNALTPGALVAASGKFDDFNGNTKFILTTFETVSG